MGKVYVDGDAHFLISEKVEKQLRCTLKIDRPNKIESLDCIQRDRTQLLACKNWLGHWRYIAVTDSECAYELSKTEMVAVALALAEIKPDQLCYTVMADEGCVKTAIILNDGQTTTSITEHCAWKHLTRMTGGDEPISRNTDIEYKRVITALCDIQKLGIEGYIKKCTATVTLPL